MVDNNIGSAFLAIGLIGLGGVLGYSIVKVGCIHSQNSNMIEVKGLSEKKVRADIGTLSISVPNNGFDNLDDLYKKRTHDKEKVIAFLKSNGVSEDEMTFSVNTWDYSDENKTTENGVTTTVKKRLFSANDTVNVKTKDVDKVGKIKADMMKLVSEGILATCDYSYKLTNFVDIKLEMMEEASKNARRNAEVFIAPQGYSIGEVVYLKQGEVTITGDDESENTNSWNSEERQSINKKLRLVVRAGFSKQKK